MKTRSIFLSIVCSFITIFAVAQTKAPALKSEEIKVWGNCGMCKSTIEKAAKAGGASTAIWNEDTKILKVKFAAAKTSGAKIQEKIAAAGYDTKDLTANDEAYNNLHDCCKYDRKAVTGMKHYKACCSDANCSDAKECCTDKCAKDAKDCCKKA
ncbi:MAG: heavy-metal-associated domain-containing protein [Sediminibacterium sp.]